MPNVQQKTPDDGQRSCPKHVEFYDRIKLGNQCFWFVIKKKKVQKISSSLSKCAKILKISRTSRQKKHCYYLRTNINWGNLGINKRHIGAFCMLHSGRYLKQLLPPGRELTTWYVNTDNDTISFQDFQICLRILIRIVSDFH